MKQKLGFALLFAALVLCLSGCRSSYTRSEVRTYTWKLLHYSPFLPSARKVCPWWVRTATQIRSGP